MDTRTNYERDTLTAYCSRERAANYKRYHTRDWSWARFCTWFEQRALAKELARYEWTENDKLLDIPCGTGILGKLLRSFPFKIVASDISKDMIALAEAEYPHEKLIDCVQDDITCTKFPRISFSCVVTLGFFHRVPLEIKRSALLEISRLSNGVAIITCSVDTRSQRIKKKVLSFFRREYIPAPCPITLSDLITECEAAGFRVVRSFMVVPFLSAEAMLVLEKKSIAC